jgi:hypothetical protein
MVRVLKTFLVALFPGSSRKGSGELLFSDLGDCGGALFLVNALYHSVFEAEFPLLGSDSLLFPFWMFGFELI